MEKYFYKSKEVAQLFGCAAKTIARKARTVPGFPQPRKIGRTVVFVKSEVDAFLRDLPFD